VCVIPIPLNCFPPYALGVGVVSVLDDGDGQAQPAYITLLPVAVLDLRNAKFGQPDVELIPQVLQ
jgi:hypothetical protein